MQTLNTFLHKNSPFDKHNRIVKRFAKFSVMWELHSQQIPSLFVSAPNMILSIIDGQLPLKWLADPTRTMENSFSFATKAISCFFHRNLLSTSALLFCNFGRIWFSHISNNYGRKNSSASSSIAWTIWRKFPSTLYFATRYFLNTKTWNHLLPERIFACRNCDRLPDRLNIFKYTKKKQRLFALLLFCIVFFLHDFQTEKIFPFFFIQNIGNHFYDCCIFRNLDIFQRISPLLRFLNFHS